MNHLELCLIFLCLLIIFLIAGLFSAEQCSSISTQMSTNIYQPAYLVFQSQSLQMQKPSELLSFRSQKTLLSVIDLTSETPHATRNDDQQQ